MLEKGLRPMEKKDNWMSPTLHASIFIWWAFLSSLMDVSHKYFLKYFPCPGPLQASYQSDYYHLRLVPKKSPQCHNSSGSTLWKKCHLFATYGLTYLCRYVHPNGRLLWAREHQAGESYPPSSKLVDMHANCRISAYVQRQQQQLREGMRH